MKRLFCFLTGHAIAVSWTSRVQMGPGARLAFVPPRLLVWCKRCHSNLWGAEP